MNQEYILLGGLLWKVMKKKVFFWRNHPKGTFLTNIAVFFSNKVFYTSPFSYTARFKKKGVRMSAGIDIEKFKRIATISRIQSSILSLGRISPVKDTRTIVDAFSILHQQRVFFHGVVYGGLTSGDEQYYKEVVERGASQKGMLTFYPSVRNSETPTIYNQNEIFINATTTGSFDKTILEAMACETLVIVSNKSFANVLPPSFLFEEKNVDDLASKIKNVLSLSDEEKKVHGKEFREYVVRHHNLNMVVREIAKMT